MLGRATLCQIGDANPLVSRMPAINLRKGERRQDRWSGYLACSVHVRMIGDASVEVTLLSYYPSTLCIRGTRFDGRRKLVTLVGTVPNKGPKVCEK